jgi:hypothetical protein
MSTAAETLLANAPRREPLSQSHRMGQLRPDRPLGPTSACRRCQRPAPDLDSPPALYWELIAQGGEVSA